MRARWAVFSLSAAAVLSVSADARADSASPAEPITIDYAAAAACPSEERFLDRVRRHTTRWTVDTKASTRTFTIRLEPRGESFEGSVVIAAPDGTTTSRAIVDADCETVARALAVVVALAIDPAARFGEAPPETPPEPPEALAPPARSPTVSLPLPRPVERSPSRFTYAIEGRVEVTSAVVTGLLPVVGAAFDARVRLGESTWLQPSLALGIRQSFLREVDAPIGSSAFLWTAGTARLCPVRLLLGRLDLAPCLEVDLGVLQAAARGVADARRKVTPWFDRGLSLRAAVVVARGWGVGVGTLATVPSSRRRFTFETGELLSQAPAVGVTVGLFVELRP